ncbi:MAG: threonine--tRNA ligase [Deltaproteobacteria bacterium]|nr:threonine--tRNA ligase [Deltaproteobacteria bacterium]
MNTIKVTLPDNRVLSCQSGSVGKEFISQITKGLLEKAIALKVNEDKIIDLHTPLYSDCAIRVLTPKDPEALQVLRHSTAHIMSEAVQALYPKAKVTIGPATETGFYYDYDYDPGFTEEDLLTIEHKMKEIISQKNPFQRTVCSKTKAIQKFKALHEDYKVEIIEGIPDPEVSIYQQGDWTDLCRGPHLPHTGWVKAFKLLSVAGAYWRGNEKNKMLQRIYGTAFFSQKDLDDYLKLQEEAKKRDHRKLGKDLDLFSFHPEAPAMPFFHEKGTILYETILAYYYKNILNRARYQIVKTPFIFSEALWKKSGHYENYRENMYFTSQEEMSMAIKPMNCPGHILVYKNSQHSYRELPIRIAEFGFVHRYERSGVVQGLFRVRGFAQDDAHHFCTEDQMEMEVMHVLQDILKTYEDFGFQEVRIELSTRPKKSIGTDAMWQRAEATLESALHQSKINFSLNPGEGAFYGPKIDFHIKDSLNRTWQCGTLQLDFSFPERLDVDYIGEDGHRHRVVMIHRAILGSVERFMGILIEHYAGSFPLWLAPVQAIILNVTDAQKSYAESIYQAFVKENIRVEIDIRNEKLGYKIRQAQLQKIPYMIILGDKEVSSKTVTIRKRDGQNLDPMEVNKVIERIKHECIQKV